MFIFMWRIWLEAKELNESNKGIKDNPNRYILHYILYIGLDKKVCLVFFRKIKDTFFIFTNNFIDLDIPSMSAISRMV